MTLFTDVANFTAGTNCTIESLQFHDFSDATGITLQQGLASGAAAITGGVARLTTPTNPRGVTGNPGSIGTCPRALLDAATNGDFDIQIDIAAYGEAGITFTGFAYRVDDNDYVLLYHYLQTGTWKTRIGKWVAGSRILEANVPEIGSGTPQLRLVRSTNDFTGYVRAVETDAWTEIGTMAQAFGTTGNVCVVTDYGAEAALVTDYDNVVAWSGFTLPFDTGAVVYAVPESIFLMHDSGQLYLNAGENNGWDNATADDAAIGSGTIKYKISDYNAPQGFADEADVIANANWNDTWLTKTQYRLLPQTDLTYRYQKTQITGALAKSAFTAFSMLTYSLDVTPPTGMVANLAIGGDAGDVTILGIIGKAGTDADSEYVATTLQIRSGDDLYEILADGTTQEAGTETEPDNLWNLDGGDVAEANVVDMLAASGATAISRFQDATQARLVGWDSLDNNAASDEIDVTPTELPAADDPTGLTVTDTGDGVTWTVTTTGAAAGAAIYVYNNSGDALITIVDASGKTADLVAGTDVYVRALEPSKTISDARYPAAAGVAVPELVMVSPDAPTTIMAVGDDGTVILTIIAANPTDKIYVRYAEYATEIDGWSVESEMLSRTGTGTITVTGSTNGTRYEFGAYTRLGALTSDWIIAATTPHTEDTAHGHTPAELIKAALIDADLGTAPGDAEAWPIYTAHMPDDPDEAVCLYDTQGVRDGRNQRSGASIHHPGWQVRVRGGSHTEACTKANAIAAGLDAMLRTAVVVGVDSYTIQAVKQTSTVMALGQEPDGKRRSLFTINGTVTFTTGT